MQLFYSTTSPYVRKVRVTAIEKGLAGQIDLRLANAHGVDEALRAANPLSRIPTLILDDGSALYVGHIAAGCALGYLGFRLPEIDWYSAHPRLAGWYLRFAERPAMVETVPVDSPR